MSTQNIQEHGVSEEAGQTSFRRGFLRAAGIAAVSTAVPMEVPAATQLDGEGLRH
jgi:hypothetical protein